MTIPQLPQTGKVKTFLLHLISGQTIEQHDHITNK